MNIGGPDDASLQVSISKESTQRIIDSEIY